MEDSDARVEGKRKTKAGVTFTPPHSPFQVASLVLAAIPVWLQFLGDSPSL